MTDTHGVRLDFGKHRGELYTRAPIPYLKWMVNENHSRSKFAKAELERRNIQLTELPVEISGHAMDTASLRVRRTWHEDRGSDEGLHSWLMRVAVEALESNKPDIAGCIFHKGMKLVFVEGELYPTLKTVMRDKGNR